MGENLWFIAYITNFKLSVNISVNIFSCHQTPVLPPELRANRRPKFCWAAVNKMMTFPDIKCANIDPIKKITKRNN